MQQLFSQNQTGPTDDNEPAKIVAKYLGTLPYRDAWEIQKSAQRHLIDGGKEQLLFVCEHPPVITLGRRGQKSNILESEDQLHKKSIEVIEVERGGDVTYHGPGQLVAYPILNLNNYKTDVGWYMRTLEAIIIGFLSQFGIIGTQLKGKTGVWVSKQNGPPEKIAAIGVRISRWCTLHGLSINVKNCKEGFMFINPCGFTDLGVTSISDQGPAVNMEETARSFAEYFIKNFKT